MEAIIIIGHAINSIIDFTELLLDDSDLEAIIIKMWQIKLVKLSNGLHDNHNQK